MTRRISGSFLAISHFRPLYSLGFSHLFAPLFSRIRFALDGCLMNHRIFGLKRSSKMAYIREYVCDEETSVSSQTPKIL
jgi:hypothetical protein